MVESSIAEIQDQYCSSYDKAKPCSFDVEFIDTPTKPLIHQASRFLYFFKGTGTMKVNGAAYKIKPNTLVAILPWETSEISEVTQPLQFYKVIYNADFVSRAMRFGYGPDHEQFSFMTAIEQTPVAYLSSGDAEPFLQVMQSLKNEVGIDSFYEDAQGKELSNIFTTSKLVELVVLYYRVITRQNSGGKSIFPTSDNSRLIFKYLYSHLSQRLTLSKVSAVVYMSESSISKYVTDVTGMSFSDVLNEMRIAKAIDMLTYTDMTLGEVAELCGFTDASHLSKVFSSRIGATANEYRKINKRAENIFQDSEKNSGFELIAYINQHYSDEDLNIQTVIRRFHMTAQEINRVLLLHMEKNFDDLLNYIRINRACEYLLTTDSSILDIAVEVGYNNIKTFNRNFAKLKQMTPGNFRKTMTLQIGGESIAK